MSDFRTLVVYFSRGGNSRKVAEEIARSLGGADLEEIRDTVNRKGLLGWIRSGRDAMKRRVTKLMPSTRDVRDYDLIVVGGPVWFSALSSPVRTWLRTHSTELRAVAFFLTHGGTARDEVFGMMQAESRIAPRAVLSVREKELGKAETSVRIASFATELRNAMAASRTTAPA